MKKAHKIYSQENVFWTVFFFFFFFLIMFFSSGKPFLSFNAFSSTPFCAYHWFRKMAWCETCRCKRFTRHTSHFGGDAIISAFDFHTIYLILFIFIQFQNYQNRSVFPSSSSCLYRYTQKKNPLIFFEDLHFTWIWLKFQQINVI